MTYGQAIAVSKLLYDRGIGHTFAVDAYTGHCSIELTVLQMPEEELIALAGQLREKGTSLSLTGGRLRVVAL